MCYEFLFGSQVMAMSHCHNPMGWQALAGQSRVWSQKRRVTSAAHASAPIDGGKQQEQAANPSSSKDLKIALGIDKDDSKENQEISRWSLLLDKIQETADYVTEATEKDSYQVKGLQFLISLFPIWLLYLLVAAGAIQLPFPLPFLDNWENAVDKLFYIQIAFLSHEKS